MSTKNGAPQGIDEAPYGAEESAFVENERCRIIALIAGSDNEAPKDDLFLDELLAMFVSLNYDKFHPELCVFQDTQELPKPTLWRRARAKCMKKVGLTLVEVLATQDLND